MTPRHPTSTLFPYTTLFRSLLLWQNAYYRIFLEIQALFYALTLISMWVPIQRLWKPLGIPLYFCTLNAAALFSVVERSEEHTSELQSRRDLVCRLLLEKKNT